MKRLQFIQRNYPSWLLIVVVLAALWALWVIAGVVYEVLFGSL